MSFDAADGFVDNELFISEEHFAELSKEYGVPKADDIVITAIGTIGNAHVVRECDRFYFKDASVLWMKRTAEVSSEFVNLWLKSPVFFDQLDRGNGATVDTLTIQKLQSVEISVPRWPNSSGSSDYWTKRLRASPPRKPTPKRTSKTPAPSSKAISKPSSPSAARGGWRRRSATSATSSMASHSRAVMLSPNHRPNSCEWGIFTATNSTLIEVPFFTPTALRPNIRATSWRKATSSCLSPELPAKRTTVSPSGFQTAATPC